MDERNNNFDFDFTPIGQATASCQKNYTMKLSR